MSEIIIAETHFESISECFKACAKALTKLMRREAELQETIDELDQRLMHIGGSGANGSVGQALPKSLIEKEEIYASLRDEREGYAERVENISVIINRINKIIMRLPKEAMYPAYIIFVKGNKNRFDGGSRYNSEVLDMVVEKMTDGDVKFLESKINDEIVEEDMLKVGLRKKKK